ncbi:MAG: hypothetical protein Tsb008_20920 [Rhodothalassiaceae bacterium]
MGFMSAWKRSHGLRIALGCVAVILVGALLALLAGTLFGFRLWQKEWKAEGETDLAFMEVSIPFLHKADLAQSLPFMAAAAIDIDGDGQDELFLGGGRSQNDAILAFRDGAFIDVTSGYGLEKSLPDASMGAASLDIDGDGMTELFVARESGIWLYRFGDEGAKGERLPLKIADNTVPLSIALGDVDKDGAVDLYVSGYIRADLVKGETIFSDGYGGYSHLFMNGGDNSWLDRSREAGVWRQHNTFTAVFVDLDNDRDSDLVIAQDTGKVEMYENTGGFPMRPIANPSVYSYPMGIAAGDYDNDGLIDLYFSNVGHTMPEALLRGDLDKDAPFNPDYMLFHNQGGLVFEDVARALNAARYGFGWGVVFADMNLDGHEDILAAQNYIRFPANELLVRYPGKLLQYYPEERKFMPVEKAAGVKNRKFGIAPVISDFNGDGAPDIVWANLDGPARAFLSRDAAKRNWVAVQLPNEARSLNAIVRVTTGDGRHIMKQLIASQGLGSDQSRRMIFGLGESMKVARITVTFMDGETVSYEAPPLRRTLKVAR